MCGQSGRYKCLSCLSLLQWAYELGQGSETKVSVPLHGCEHFYLLTKPLQDPLPPSTPGLLIEQSLVLSAGTVANRVEWILNLEPNMMTDIELLHFDCFLLANWLVEGVIAQFINSCNNHHLLFKDVVHNSQ